MAESSSSSSSGIGFFGALGLLFIGLKLGGVISWSWWWVLLPMYGGLVLVVLFFAGFFLWHYIADKRAERKLNRLRKERGQ